MNKHNGTYRPDTRHSDYQILEKWHTLNKKDEEWLGEACGKLNLSWGFDGCYYHVGEESFPCALMTMKYLSNRLRYLLPIRRTP